MVWIRHQSALPYTARIDLLSGEPSYDQSHYRLCCQTCCPSEFSQVISELFADALLSHRNRYDRG